MAADLPAPACLILPTEQRVEAALASARTLPAKLDAIRADAGAPIMEAPDNAIGNEDGAGEVSMVGQTKTRDLGRAAATHAVNVSG